MKKSIVSIIGAGVSGLIAAKVLENKGITVQIFEATDKVGGRVKTDFIQNYQLDYGFQVLLGAYPYAQKYLDYDQLNLQELLPGAKIFKDKPSLFGDPLRNLSFLWPVITSLNATIKDKWLIFKLQKELKKQSFEAIFEKKETSTYDYLKGYGFSEIVIQNFFKPFYSGIFLENNLSSSSRMFEFVFKCFAQGKAFIPKDGIQAIPDQLYKSLKNTTIHFNVKIDKVENNKLFMNGLASIDSDYIIIATEPNELVLNLRNQELVWNTCDCLYFEVDQLIDNRAIIGLIASDTSLINNVFFPQTVNTRSRGEKELLSATVVKEHDFSDADLISKVTSDLKEFCKIESFKFLKHYKISKALPILDGIQYDIPSSETQLTEHVFLAGDHLLNPSLNAAIISGERAAKAVISQLEGIMK